MKKTLILLFSFLFIWTSTFPVKASEIQPIDSTDIIEVFDDGSYIESFTEENIIITLSRSSSTKSARRTYTYKSSTGKTLWTITVTVQNHLYLLHALPVLLNYLQNQQQNITPLRLLLPHLNSTMILSI